MKLLLCLLLTVGAAQADPFNLYEENKPMNDKKKYELIPSDSKVTSTYKKNKAEWEISCYMNGKSIPGFERLLLSDLNASIGIYQGLTIAGVRISVPSDNCFVKSLK